MYEVENPRTQHPGLHSLTREHEDSEEKVPDEDTQLD